MPRWSRDIQSGLSELLARRYWYISLWYILHYDCPAYDELSRQVNTKHTVMDESFLLQETHRARKGDGNFKQQ